MSENPSAPQDPYQPEQPAQPGEPTQPPVQPGAYPPPGGQQPPTQPYGQQPPVEPGAYPPPGGQQPYGQQPPSGSYPPPPAGFPNAPQAAPGAYGTPGGQVTVGESFNYGWTKFTQNFGGIILGVILYWVILVVIGVIFFGVLGGFSAASNDNSSTFAALSGFTLLLFVGVMIVFVTLMQAGIIRAALEISYGRQIDVKTFFNFTDLGRVFVAALLVGLITGVGYVLCIIPGIVFAFFAQFTLFYVIDKGMTAGQAIGASVRLVNKNLGTVIALYIGVLVANWIGGLLCGIGVLVSIPVGLLATTFMYRRLNGEQVAA